MQEDFLCSPINRQIGCKQYTSNVVGGPATTILPVCSVFICNDDCTTGNLTYQITPLDAYYGKRIVIIKTVDTTGSGFKVRLSSASANFVSSGSATLDLPDLPSTTELVFPIGPGSEIGVSSYDAASGSTINIYTADGTLTGIRTVDMNGQVLIFQGNGNDFFQLDNIQELDVQATTNISIDCPQILVVPQFPLDNASTELMVQEVGTGQIKRRAVSSIPDTNIYNTSGSLTSGRSVTLNSFPLTFTGTGTFTIQNTGQLSLQNTGLLNVGAANSTSVNVGFNGNTTNLQSNQLLLNNIPQSVSTTFTGQDLVIMNSSTKVVNRIPSNLYTRSMFSLGRNPNSGTLTLSATSNMDNLITTNPTNHPGYNLDPANVNLGTGVFSIPLPAPSYCNILFKIELKNSAGPGRYTLQLYDQVNAVVISSATFTSPTTDGFDTHTLEDSVLIGNLGVSYVFRVVNLDAAGTTSYQNAVMSVTRI